LIVSPDNEEVEVYKLNNGVYSLDQKGAHSGFLFLLMPLFKGAAFVNGDVVGLAGFDLVLGIIGGGMMDVSLIIEIFGVDLCDRARDMACLGIPGYVVAYFEGGFHRSFEQRSTITSTSLAVNTSGR